MSSREDEPQLLQPVDVGEKWLVPFDGSFRQDHLVSSASETGKHNKQRLKSCRKALRPLQEALYASQHFSILCIFQALDAAGKDGAIRTVFKGMDPSCLKVASFKKPSVRELAHDFLWRTTAELPGRGRIGIFNRSYYEEVLVVRVHPGFLDAQYPLGAPDPADLWPIRYRAIREHERHLAAANTVVLKFWLHVSPEEQARRFLDRIDQEDKRWKFSAGDVREAREREKYDAAVLEMLNATSRPWAPWFVIPADDKRFMRVQVAEILQRAMQALPLVYPQPDVEDEAEMEAIAGQLRRGAVRQRR